MHWRRRFEDVEVVVAGVVVVFVALGPIDFLEFWNGDLLGWMFWVF